MIKNTDQKVTDAYRDNPFWDSTFKLKGTMTGRIYRQRCQVCGGLLDDNQQCINLLEQQKERT